MIVIADTSPINYLVLIEHIEALPKLYGRILIPPSVHEELQRARTPEVVRRWLAHPPSWLEIVAPKQPPDAELIEADLDSGERDAILLAQELGADELIIDDMCGRLEAQRRHLPVTGTIGVLRAAARRGLLDLRGALARLRFTNFHIAEEVLDRLIREEKV
jgi:predicted nucleic acid-binding protein